MFKRRLLKQLLDLYFNSLHFTLVETVVLAFQFVEFEFAEIVAVVPLVVVIALKELPHVVFAIIKLHFLNLEALVLSFFFLSLTFFLS
jgi:hypothetical protein